MSTYLTNAELHTKLNTFEIFAPGYEVSIEKGWSRRFGSGRNAETVTAYSSVCFLKGFYEQGRIIDRTTGTPASRRQVALIATRANGGFLYRTTPGPKGAVRYGWAATEQDALDQIEQWMRRRFAHVTRAES